MRVPDENEHPQIPHSTTIYFPKLNGPWELPDRRQWLNEVGRPLVAIVQDLFRDDTTVSYVDTLAQNSGRSPETFVTIETVFPGFRPVGQSVYFWKGSVRPGHVE